MDQEPIDGQMVMIPPEKKPASVYRKSDTLAANEERIRNIVTLGAAGLMRVSDKDKKIRLSDTEAVKEVTIQYVNMCAKYSILPNMSGLAKALGMSRQALYYHISHHPDNDETTEWLKDCSDSFGQMMMDAALSGVVAPIPAIYMAKARYFWRENDIPDSYSSSKGYERYSAEEIAERYTDLPD